MIRRARSVEVTFAMFGLAVVLPTTTFTIVDALILRPVTFKDVDQLATVIMGSPRGGPSPTSDVLRAWKASPAFAAVAGARTATALVTTGAGAATRQMAHVTPELFDLLGGVRPIRGRLFDATEGRPGTDDRVLLSEDVWRSLYDADPALVGRAITIDNQPVTVVGILPADFRFPNWNTVVWKADTFEANPSERPSVYVRFAPTIPRADALGVATRAAQSVNASYAKQTAQARSLAGDQLDQYYQRAVPLLSGGVILLFLVLCANVSSLLLTGFTARGREFATRAALGASRGRLVRQAFLESALCGTGGIIAGAAVGWVLVSVSRVVLPQAALLRSLNPLNIDARALILTSIAGLVATFVAGVLPAV